MLAYPCFFTDSSTAAAVLECLRPPPRLSVATQRAAFLVGDSHASVARPALERALSGKMTLAFAAMASTRFWGKYEATTKYYYKHAFVQQTVAALRTHLRPGDVVIVVNYKGDNQPSWYRSLVQETIRPANASLVLFGDYPVLNRPPTTCRYNHALCSRDEEADELRSRHDTDITTFADNTADVFSFLQAPFWAPEPGDHWWGNVPGTTINAFYDDNHLLEKGTLYAAPYMCSAFARWGFFDPI